MTDDIDTLLRQRRFEPAATNLEERIIAAARIPSPSARPRRSILAEWLLPRPAFAMACALLFGLLAGLQLPSEWDDTPENFLYDEGELL